MNSIYTFWFGLIFFQPLVVFCFGTATLKSSNSSTLFSMLNIQRTILFIPNETQHCRERGAGGGEVPTFPTPLSMVVAHCLLNVNCLLIVHLVRVRVTTLTPEYVCTQGSI